MSSQSVPLHHLPVRTLSAAANMAVDTLLLEHYPQPDAPRFRHYGWADPAFTFGRTQPCDAARRALPVHISWQEAHERFAKAFQLVRRPTGGGIVDHRADWTYALVIPASHPLYRACASGVYRDCHRVLAEALAEQGVAAELAPCRQACATPEVSATAADPVVKATGSGAASASAASACFTQAEPFDVVGEGGVKLAGAAQRRSRDGLLVQGSVSRTEVGGINWQRFEQDVVEGFARWLAQTDGLAQTPPQPASVLVKDAPFPKWPADLLKETVARFASPAWTRRR